jgi:hypothetical protein
VYICFGIFFIAGLSKGSLILRYLWKTKFRGKLSRHNAATNAQVLAQIAKAELPHDVIAPLLTVDAAYLEAALVVDQEYAGMENDLRTVLDVDVQRIRRNDLE